MESFSPFVASAMYLSTKILDDDVTFDWNVLLEKM